MFQFGLKDSAKNQAFFMNADENIHALLSFKDIIIKVPPVIHPQLDYHIDFYIGTVSEVNSMG